MYNVHENLPDESSHIFNCGYIKWIPLQVYLPETVKFNISGKGDKSTSFTGIDDICGWYK